MKKARKLVRTSIALPEPLKEKVEKSGINLSREVREFLEERFRGDKEVSMIEAAILTERLRRPAPAGFSSLKVIKAWRREH